MADVQYKTAQVNSINIFYRTAGAPSLPGLLLLHGHASASHAFRNILPMLADFFHVVAPDYPGFGNSDRPDPKDYQYTFANLAGTIDGLTEQIGLSKYFVYLFDFGAPVGLTMATKHPERILGIFTQSGNAYTEGLAPAIGKNLQALWANPEDPIAIEGVKHIFTPEGIEWAYRHGIEPPTRVGPDAPALDTYYTSRDGAIDIQLLFLRDYETNVNAYPGWQAYLREHNPKVVGLWGKHDPFFIPPGAEAFKRDVPSADVRIVEDGGHFLNETHPGEVVKALKKLL